MDSMDTRTSSVTASAPPSQAERYRRLASDLRAAAAECQALGESMPSIIAGKSPRDTARLLRQAAEVADRAHWLFNLD